MQIHSFTERLSTKTDNCTRIHYVNRFVFFQGGFSVFMHCSCHFRSGHICLSAKIWYMVVAVAKKLVTETTDGWLGFFFSILRKLEKAFDCPLAACHMPLSVIQIRASYDVQYEYIYVLLWLIFTAAHCMQRVSSIIHKHTIW